MFINKSPQKRLEIATLKFSILSNFVALLGGKIKSKQMISGNMADILSNLYLGYSLIWYHHHYLKDNSNDLLKNESIEYLMNELEYKMNVIIENYPIQLFYPFLYPLKNKNTYPVLENKNKLYEFVLKNKEVHEIFKKDIYYKGTILEKMEKLNRMDKKSIEYESLYQEVIQVGEYPIK